MLKAVLLFFCGGFILVYPLCACVCVRVCESAHGELSQEFGGALSPSCPENRLGPYIIHSLQPIHSILPSSSHSLALFLSLSPART